MNKRLILFLMLCPLWLWAQDDPKLTVSAKKQVVVGERFQVVFEANAEGRNFSAPSFEGFNVVGGPFTSSSSSIQMTNVGVTRTVRNSYTYALQAYQEGNFHIGSASLTVNGDKITSEPFDIKVLPDDGNNNGGGAGGYSGGSSTRGQPQQSTNDPGASGKDLFLKVVPSKKSVYVGEQLVLTYKLYTKVPVSSLSVEKMPSYAGFWTKDISENNGGALRQSSEYINGVEYTVAEIQKMVIVPQRSGNLSLEPMTIECLAQIRTESNRRSNDPFDIFFNDPFFNRNIKNVRKSLNSSSLIIEVKKLPVADKPNSFAGDVGSYSFKSEVDKTELSTNEAFTLTYTVSGQGNIELLQMPTPVLPPDFEIYDPNVTISVDHNAQGFTGTKKAEFLVIPRRAGNFNVPAVEFAYFNPANGTYQTLCSDAYTLAVQKGKDSEQSGGIYASNQEGIKYIGSDIRHIKRDDAKLRPMHTTFFGSAAYYVALLGLLSLFVILLLVLKKREQLTRDTAANRNRKADKVARGRLKNALQYLKTKDQEKFYVEMSQALWGYIADKTGIERSKLSMDTVSETMRAKNVPDDLTQQFVDTLNSCEFARFAPGSAEEKMDELYQKGIEVISKAEKVL